MAEINLYLILIASIGFDLLVGDPKFLIHPVQIIGLYINKTTNFFINNFKCSSNILFLGSLYIALSTISISYFIGKFIEIIYFKSEFNIFCGIFILIGLSSCFATKSLLSSVKEISKLMQNQFTYKKQKQIIIEKVQRIVSRDVRKASFENLLRATIESLTENSVDGIFAPLFWVCLGAFLIKQSIFYPGPLSLGFTYKALSTLDSMIGYKHDHLKRLGFFSAKIEDYATFIPCKLVVFSLPVICLNFNKYFYIIKKVFEEGSKYESPNAGFSEGIFAYIVDIKLGGENKYNNDFVFKPLLNKNGHNCEINSISKIIRLIYQLKLFWILLFSFIYFIN